MGEGRQSVPRLTSGPAPPGVASDSSLLVLCSFQTRVSWGLWVCPSIQNPFWKKNPLFLFHLAETELEFSMRNFASETGNQTSPKVLEKKKTNYSTSVDFHRDQTQIEGGGRAGGTLPTPNILLLASSLPAPPLRPAYPAGGRGAQPGASSEATSRLGTEGVLSGLPGF